VIVLEAQTIGTLSKFKAPKEEISDTLQVKN